MSNFKVYKFGLLSPTENGKIVYEQMFLNHRYRNTLNEIECGRRNAVRLITRENDENIRNLENEFSQAEEVERKIAKEIKTQHSEMRSRTSTQTDKEELKIARSNKKEIRKLLIEARKLAKSNLDIVSKLEQIKERNNELTRSAREYCKVYWGTYLLSEDAMDASRKMPLYDGMKDNNPKFLSWRYEGSVGVQLQGGLEVPKIFGANTQIHIDPVDENAFYGEKRKDRRKLSRTILRLRVGSDEKLKPIWASWPMIMHRSLPKGGVIKKATVQLKKIGPTEEWSVSITVDMSNCLSPSVGAIGAVAFDLGWRDMKDQTGNSTGFRIGKWRGEDNKIEEVKLDIAIVDGIKKANDIKSVRDDNFNIMKTSLVEWLKKNVAILPPWINNWRKITSLSKWRSIAQLVALTKHWKSNRFDGDEDIFGVSGKWIKDDKKVVAGTGLAGWAYHDYHLWLWESDQRTKSLRRRKEYFRIEAAKLAKQYKTLVIEDFDLRDVSQTPEPDAKDDNQKGRANRVLSSPSEFRLALINAFVGLGGEVVKIDPAGTSYTCHLCSSPERLDHMTHLHTCSRCGETWDREDNATANLLNRWRERFGGAGTPGVARNDEKSNDPAEMEETRYQRRNRAKQEKALRQATARKANANPAELLIS